MKPISKGNGGSTYGLRVPVDCGPQMKFHTKNEAQDPVCIASLDPALSIEFTRNGCIIYADEIDSSNSARHLHNWIRNSLLHMCVEHRLSIDTLQEVVEATDQGLWLHPDTLLLRSTAWAKSDRIPVLETWSHMPTLFPDGKNVVMNEVVRSRPVWLYEQKKFLGDFESTCHLYSDARDSIEPRVAAACQMFGNASRNTTQVANLLSFVTILEMLTPRPRAGTQIRDAADKLIKLAKTSFPELSTEDLNILTNRIGEAKRLSIKKSIVQSIEALRDSSFEDELASELAIDRIDIDELVTELYWVRSQYVHAGYPSTSEFSPVFSFGQLYALARTTARQLLLNALAAFREKTR